MECVNARRRYGPF